MFATTIRFTVPADSDLVQLRQLAVRRAREALRLVPGLRSGALALSPERRELAASFVWATVEHAEAFLRSEAWRAAVAQYGEPRVERAEVCAYVEEGALVFPPDPDEPARRAGPWRAEQAAGDQG